MRRVIQAVAAGSLTAVVALGMLAAPSADARPAPARKHAQKHTQQHAQKRAASTPGTYVALPQQVRAVDTRKGGNGVAKGAVKAGGGINPRVSGFGSLSGSAVGSVVVTITAISPTATGAVVAFPYGSTRPGTTTLRFAKGQRAVSGTAVVPVRNFRIGIHNSATSGSVQLAVDVSGYYVSGTTSSSEPGVYRPVTPRRFIDTRSGYGGVKKARVAAGKSIDVKLGSRGGLPAVPGAAAITITAVSPTKAGTITGGRPDEPLQGYGYANFAAGETVSAFAPMRVADGVARITNSSSGTVDLVVDVVGYWNLGFAQQAGNFQTRIQTRVTPTVTVPAGASTAVQIGRKGGVEPSASAAVLTLHALAPDADGGLRASQSGVDAGAGSVLQWSKGRSTANVAVVPMGDGGQVTLTNPGSTYVDIAIDIDGYVPSTTTTALTGKATARYLDKLTGTIGSDETKMAAYGTADGKKGYGFVLLDVGAQTISKGDSDSRGDELSGTVPGVVIAKAAPRVAYTYEHLRDLVQKYINAYVASAPSATPIIAVGTNNDGVWDDTKTDYISPTKRGQTWADQVISPLMSDNGVKGVTVRGANDIESGFASNQEQAKQWETAYLSSFAGTSPELYFNGSADGCPVTWNAATCKYDWTPDDYYELASQEGVVAVPQIYVGSQATQWAEISAAHGGDLEFAGILSEYTLNPDFLSPLQATSALNRALTAVGSSPLPGFVANFQK